MSYKVKQPTKCKYCGTTENLTVKYRKNPKTKVYTNVDYPFCLSVECQKKYSLDQELTKKKRAQTNIIKYGSANIAQVQQFKDKMKQTMVETYGVENANQSPEIIAKREKTNLERYGDTNPNRNRQVREKIEKTNMERYGYKNARQNPTVRAKAEQTMKERYGTNNIFGSEEFQYKTRQTNMAKYGVPYVSQDPTIRAKQIQGMTHKYGVAFSHLSEDIREKMITSQRELTWPVLITNLSKRGITPQFTQDEYTQSGYADKYYFCKHCKEVFSSNQYWKSVFCACRKHRSNYEDEIIDWLQELGMANIEPNKKFLKEDSKNMKYEIDVFLPEVNLGIDFHGLYWHSDIMQPNPSYHQEKWKYFNDLGIQLIQIFEHEWLQNKYIVKSIIKNIIKKNNIIHARKCEIKEIAYMTAREFLMQNHLQGAIAGTAYIGLYYNDELVGLSVFGKVRYESRSGYEIYRFCNKLDHSVVGGFDRIFAYFTEKYPTDYMVSYVDLRYFTGYGYSNLGFTKQSVSRPNYYYFKLKDNPIVLQSRIAFQKHKLATKLAKFDPLLSEAENMSLNDYSRIFDAGNMKFVKNFVI